jgi:hypothetical protein
MPAAFTRMLTGPNVRRTRSTPLATEAGSLTSTGSSAFLSKAATCTPWLASRSAVARPMPLAAPVTMATGLMRPPR